MAKPKMVTFKPTQVSNDVPSSSDLEVKLDEHIENKDIHIDKDTRDAITYLRKDLDAHTGNSDIHVTKNERAIWNTKETPEGAQSKANKVLDTLNLHKADSNIHITKAEKDLLKDKYTRAETRNLLKQGLTGLKFLASVLNKSKLKDTYPNPEYNSCVYLRTEKMTVIYNGKEWVEFNGIFTPEITGDYDGLMTNEDKVKLDSIEENANYYVHPKTHNASIVEEDSTHRFVTDEEKDNWNNKAEVEYVDNSTAKVLTSAKSFTDSKIAALLNSTEAQLEVLRSLSFDLKKDDVVKKFFDLYNECTKNKEFQAHSLNSDIHMSKSDRILLNDVKSALSSGLNPDWNETDSSSLRFIENKPTSLPANGGNADTVGGYTADQLLKDNYYYDYAVDMVEDLEQIANKLNKIQGYSVLIKPGSYKLDRELVIKASNTTITGIGDISKLLETSIKIIGNNNVIENITLTNSDSMVVNKTAIYVEGNNNTIRHNTISNYNCGIIVEGNNNKVISNNLTNIRNTAIALTAEINSNYGNIVDKNSVKNSNIGISLLSTKNSLTKNHITTNNVLNCSIGIVLSNSINDRSKTTMNIINENIVMRGRGEPSEYLSNHKTIISEYSSKNIISSNITSGKQIVAPNDVLSNNVF